MSRKRTKRGAGLAWMSAVRRGLVDLIREEEGVSAIEYGLVAALIVLAASAAITSLGGGVEGAWTLLSDRLIAVFSSVGS
jgi:pilus assembly protein Flp/PilA